MQANKALDVVEVFRIRSRSDLKGVEGPVTHLRVTMEKSPSLLGCGAFHCFVWKLAKFMRHFNQDVLPPPPILLSILLGFITHNWAHLQPLKMCLKK
jgi:hypothetical protein